MLLSTSGDVWMGGSLLLDAVISHAFGGQLLPTKTFSAGGGNDWANDKRPIAWQILYGA